MPRVARRPTDTPVAPAVTDSVAGCTKLSAVSPLSASIGWPEPESASLSSPGAMPGTSLSVDGLIACSALPTKQHLSKELASPLFLYPMAQSCIAGLQVLDC